MKKVLLNLLTIISVFILCAIPALAAGEGAVADATVSAKAIAAAIAVGLAAAGGAIAMGMAIAKSAEGISRQPEAEGKIRTTLMLGLVFIETAIIYALVIAILVIFVL
ncbi:MAG: ATP synthase F0 subunit C [Clostridiales bacterium]|nr:ATP synthase F0 subunit C [Clostridiales bacterium]